jgi:protease PrsW
VYFLRVENGVDAGRTIPLPESRADRTLCLRIGRDDDANLRFADSTMSRTQAELRWEGGAWHLLNLSKHGSFIGKRRLKAGAQRKLASGDSLLLGETRVSFLQEEAPAPLDAFTPSAPSLAGPPTLAGYDSKGRFHSGQTLLAVDAGSTFVTLLKDPDGEAKLQVKRRRLYFYALVGVLGVVGLALLIRLVAWPAYQAHPRGLLLATGLGLLPALPYLLLCKLLDRNGQVPWPNLLACALWGGAVGCGFSIVLNGLGHEAVTAFVGSGEAFTWTAILVAPLVEEVAKWLAILVLFWILHDEFDNLLEGMILGAASGLGFALVENCAYNVRFLEDGEQALWVFGSYRIVVNALIGHPIYTAMAGAGLGLLRTTRRDDPLRLVYPFLGLLAAITLHVAWNATSVYLGSALEGRELLSLISNAVLLGGGGLALFVSAYSWATRRERRVLTTYLSEEIEKGFVERAELDSFYETLGRLRYELGGLRHGWTAYRLRRALRKAQVELAFRKWHLARGEEARGQGSDRDIRRLRDRIRDLRNALISLGANLDTGAEQVGRGVTTSLPELVGPTPESAPEEPS